jgi:hypothetical protein
LVSFFGGLLIRERSFWEALEGYFQRVGNPRKVKRSQDPWFVKVHTHSFYMCLTQKLSLSLSTFPGSNIFPDMAKQ